MDQQRRSVRSWGFDSVPPLRTDDEDTESYLSTLPQLSPDIAMTPAPRLSRHSVEYREDGTRLMVLEGAEPGFQGIPEPWLPHPAWAEQTFPSEATPTLPVMTDIGYLQTPVVPEPIYITEHHDIFAPYRRWLLHNRQATGSNHNISASWIDTYRRRSPRPKPNYETNKDAATDDRDHPRAEPEEYQAPPATRPGRPERPTRCRIPKAPARLGERNLLHSSASQGCQFTETSYSKHRSHATDEKTDEVVFWPALKQYMLNPIEKCKPVVGCAICHEGPLAIKGIRYPDAKPASCAGREHALVLPCGHIVGNKCMSAWREEHERNQMHNRGIHRPLRCPLCNFALGYSLCSHAIRGVLAPVYPEDTVEQIPLTIPEGGSIPKCCHDCGRDTFVREREVSRDRLFGLVDQPRNVIAGLQASQRRLRQLILEEYNILTNLIPSWANLDRAEI